MASTDMEWEFLYGDVRSGSGTPTKKHGGYIANEKDFKKFMYKQAKDNQVEVAAYGLSDGTFFVQPWYLNSDVESVNKTSWLPHHTANEISKQYHTHPNSGAPSWNDVLWSHEYARPVYIFTANQRMYKVRQYPRGYAIPRYFSNWMYAIRIE